jgi:hypothetical protein
MEKIKQRIIDRIKLTRDCSFLKSQPIEVTSNKNIMLAVVKQNGMALQYVSENLKEDKDIIIAAIEQNQEALIYVVEKPELWTFILDDELDIYDYFPLHIKQNEEIMLYILIHSQYRCKISLDKSLNMKNIVQKLVSNQIPSSDILQIIINGKSESIIKFAINGKLIDVPFNVSNTNMSVYPTYKKMHSCIEIDIHHTIHNLIELNDYYYLNSQSFCPFISHDMFFTILDALSFIYQYKIVLTDASKKLTTNLPYIRDVDVNTRYSCNLPKDIYAMANGSLERGRRKGYDSWSGTFYDQYGFKNDKYSKIIQKYQPILLLDYDEELFTELNNINNYNKLGLNMDTMTLQECCKFIIYLCKTEKKMKEMYLSFIHTFNTILHERLYSVEKMNYFIKPVSTKRYTIELIDDMVFNITMVSGGTKSKKRKIHKRLTYKY